MIISRFIFELSLFSSIRCLLTKIDPPKRSTHPTSRVECPTFFFGIIRDLVLKYVVVILLSFCCFWSLQSQPCIGKAVKKCSQSPFLIFLFLYILNNNENLVRPHRSVEKKYYGQLEKIYVDFANSPLYMRISILLQKLHQGLILKII